MAAKEYGLERPNKSYPRRRLLPQFEDEALAQDAADRPPRGRDKVMYQPEHQPAPRHQSTKNTKARGYTHDLRDEMEDKAG